LGPRLTVGCAGSARRPTGRSAGFTLIEILVVVMIVGTIALASVLALTAGGSDRELEQQGRRLVALLELASEEAIMQGRELALEVFEEGYRFHVYEPAADEWQALEDDVHLRARALTNGMSLALEVEGRRVTLQPGPGDMARPQVMLLSSGEFTPFRLVLQRDRRIGVQLEADARGRMELVMAEQPR
jgi:general secretion pathway protein H